MSEEPRAFGVVYASTSDKGGAGCRDCPSRLTQSTYPNQSTNTLTYNGLDTRVGKVDSSGTKTYRRDGVGVTAPVLTDGASTFTPGVSVRTSGATQFLHDDRLGTLGRETNSSQETTATKTYDAFGMPIAATGTSASPFGFAGGYGYQEDPDSGLKLLGHRYYDPSTGRFLTRDPAKDGRNWYAYCANHPLGVVDPSGLVIGIDDLLVGALVVVAIAGLAYLAHRSGPLIDKGLANKHDMDEAFFNGDETGYEDGRFRQRVLIRDVRDLLHDQYMDAYVYGPVVEFFGPWFGLGWEGAKSGNEVFGGAK